MMQLFLEVLFLSPPIIQVAVDTHGNAGEQRLDWEGRWLRVTGPELWRVCKRGEEPFDLRQMTLMPFEAALRSKWKQIGAGGVKVIGCDVCWKRISMNEKEEGEEMKMFSFSLSGTSMKRVRSRWVSFLFSFFFGKNKCHISKMLRCEFAGLFIKSCEAHTLQFTCIFFPAKPYFYIWSELVTWSWKCFHDTFVMHFCINKSEKTKSWEQHPNPLALSERFLQV